MASYGFNSTTPADYDDEDRLIEWNRDDGNVDQEWLLSGTGDWNTFTEEGTAEHRLHSAAHEITHLGSSDPPTGPLSHDAKGNLTKDAAQTYDKYRWDFDNRLYAVDTDDDDTAEVFYRYDALGRRVSSDDLSDNDQGLVYIYDGQRVVAEYEDDTWAQGRPLRTYIDGTYIDEPIAMETANYSFYYYHQNALYNVVALTNAAGNPVERYSYTAYGKPTFHNTDGTVKQDQVSSSANPYLYTGRRLDPETGLYYYRARYYDSDLGRFISRDPIGYRGGGLELLSLCRRASTTFCGSERAGTHWTSL